jgi:hypothetical protein
MPPTCWGFRRILGKLKRLRIQNPPVPTVRWIVIENGFDPAPALGPGLWHGFVRRHLRTLRACDVFTKKVWTLRGSVAREIQQIRSRLDLSPSGRGRCCILESRGLRPKMNLVGAVDTENP